VKDQEAMSKNRPSDIEVKSFATHHVISQPNPLRKVLQRVEDEKVADEAVARAEQALAGLSGEFKGWMMTEAGRLSAAYAAVRKDGFTHKACDELFRAAHDIKGDAATFGYFHAGTVAESLCRIIEHAPDLNKVPAELIDHHINAIQAIVHDHTKFDAAMVATELCRRLRRVADEYLAHANRDRPEHLEAILAPSIVPGE
jgi:chemotaxis protein histidine kinase CheA